MRKKIVIIASFANSLIQFRLHLIKEFLTLNYTVVALAPEDNSVAHFLAQIGVKFIPIPIQRNGNNPIQDLKLLAFLFNLIRKEKPSIVFTYTIKPVIYGSIAAKLARVPFIYAMLTGTGYVFSSTNIKSRIIGYIAKRLFRFSLRFNKKLFFQNKDNLITFQQMKLITKTHPTALINGSGVDITFFQCSSLPDRISFLLIARLLIDKGIREYIEAARIIKNKYPDIQFKLVGWIDTNPNSITENELQEWTHSGIVEYLGKLSDVRDVITQSSVYVLPSYGEGTPRTVLEAMSMSRPIITTDVPGCRETVIDSLNGFLVPVCDALALSKAMEYFIENPDDIKNMGQKSRHIAVEKYDVNKVNQCILNEMCIG